MIRLAWVLLGYSYYPAELSDQAQREIEVAIDLCHEICVSETGVVEHRRIYADQVPLCTFTISDDFFFSTIDDIQRKGENLGPQRRLAEIAVAKGYYVDIDRTGSIKYIPQPTILPTKPPITCISDLMNR